MKIITILLIILTGLTILSCQTEDYESVECNQYDYSDCDTKVPHYGDLVIDLTINKLNPEVEVIVFKGKPEKKDTFTIAKIDNAVLYVEVPVNQYYSVKAKYYVEDKIVYVTDGSEIKNYSYNRCDSTCWNIKGQYIDARLKYDNI